MSSGNPNRPMQVPVAKRAPANPSAVAYQRAQQTRAAGGPPKYSTPRAGGPTPPIPPLDGPPGDGTRTMSQIAMDQRRPAPQQGSIIQGGPRRPPNGLNIQPTDLLPPEAQTDPEFVQGSGSMYAFNQPHLAEKYGVLRNNRRIPPQELKAVQPGQPQVGVGPEKRQPRRDVAETVADLEKLQNIRDKVDSGEYAAEKAAEAGPAGAARNIGNPLPAAPDGEGPRQATDEEIKKRLAGMDEFDLATLHDMMVRDIINNPEQREIVEARLQPLNLGDLVVNYTVSQKIPIIPGTFEPEFESMAVEDDLELKRMIVEEAQKLKVDDQYLLYKYSLYGLTCALKSVNGKPLGTHRDENGNFDEKKLLEKFKKILKMPLPMVAALGPHYFWFDQRVRKLFAAKSIKNG